MYVHIKRIKNSIWRDDVVVWEGMGDCFSIFLLWSMERCLFVHIFGAPSHWPHPTCLALRDKLLKELSPKLRCHLTRGAWEVAPCNTTLLWNTIRTTSQLGSLALNTGLRIPIWQCVHSCRVIWSFGFKEKEWAMSYHPSAEQT